MNDILPIVPAGASPISERAERRLRESPYFFLKNIRCEFSAGVLTLRGRVPYGQLKQFAEQIVLRVEGVEHVINRVDVVDPYRNDANPSAARNAG